MEELLKMKKGDSLMSLVSSSGESTSGCRGLATGPSISRSTATRSLDRPASEPFGRARRKGTALFSAAPRTGGALTSASAGKQRVCRDVCRGESGSGPANRGPLRLPRLLDAGTRRRISGRGAARGTRRVLETGGIPAFIEDPEATRENRLK